MLLIAPLALCASLHAQTPIGELSASDASVKGAVIMTGGNTRVMSGSSVTAGASAASLHLTRGGELRVCPRSAVSLSASPNKGELMIAMGTGAIEAHYTLANTRDSIVTPDFRISLIGPGEFHLAIASDPRGNTCVRTLPRNTQAVIVEEQMGDGVHQVGPHDQALFHNGSVANPDPFASPDCGCPPAAPVQRAAVPIPPFEPTAAPSLIAPPPANEVHIQVDAPFVFRAEEPQIPSAPIVARLQAQKLPPLLVALPPVEPPAQTAKKGKTEVAAKPKDGEKKKGVFGHLRSFFATVFH